MYYYYYYYYYNVSPYAKTINTIIYGDRPERGRVSAKRTREKPTRRESTLFQRTFPDAAAVRDITALVFTGVRGAVIKLYTGVCA